MGMFGGSVENVLRKVGGRLSDVGLNLFESGVKRSVQQSFCGGSDR